MAHLWPGQTGQVRAGAGGIDHDDVPDGNGSAHGNKLVTSINLIWKRLENTMLEGQP